MDSSEFALSKLKHIGLIPICFKYPNVESIHQNIIKIGELTRKKSEAEYLVKVSKQKIESIKTTQPKKVLYLVQTTPMITVGEKSFISDIINKSGNISVTKDINSYYPVITEEFAIKSKPDVIVVSNFTDNTRVKKLFPKTKIIVMTELQNDIINRPGPRIYKSVEFFAGL